MATIPTLDQPARMRQCDAQIIEHLRAGRLGGGRCGWSPRQRELGRSLSQRAQDRVDVRCSALLSDAPGEVDGIVDHRVRRHTVKMEQLIGGEPKEVEDIGIDPADRT